MSSLPRISRRRFLSGTAAGAAAGLAAPYIARAQDKKWAGKSLRVHLYSGPDGDALQKNVIDPFQEETGAEVITEFGFTSAAVAKVRAQANDPQLDVVVQDDIGVLTLAAENMLEDLSDANLPNIDDIAPRFRYSTPSQGVAGTDLMGVGFLTYLDSIVYNSDVVPTAPQTYEDLWDAKFAGKVGLPTSGQSDALKLIIVASILAGGDQYNSEPGFKKLAELRPNIHSFWTAIPETAELIRARDMLMAFAWNYAFKPFGEKGYPIRFSTAVKEGVVAAAGAVCVPRGHPGDAELIALFIGRALSAQAQEGLARDIWYGPTNRTVQITDPTVTPWVLMPDKFDTAIPVDLLHLQTVRQEWLTKYDEILKG